MSLLLSTVSDTCAMESAYSVAGDRPVMWKALHPVTVSERCVPADFHVISHSAAGSPSHVSRASYRLALTSALRLALVLTDSRTCEPSSFISLNETEGLPLFHEI